MFISRCLNVNMKNVYVTQLTCGPAGKRVLLFVAVVGVAIPTYKRIFKSGKISEPTGEKITE